MCTLYKASFLTKTVSIRVVWAENSIFTFSTHFFHMYIANMSFHKMLIELYSTKHFRNGFRYGKINVVPTLLMSLVQVSCS